MELVDSISEVIQNAKEFNRIDDRSDCVPLQRFSQFFHWYYFSSEDIFAPSKFIGYKNTTIDNYTGEGTGGDTQRVLSNWFTKLEKSTKKYNQLQIKLKAYADSLGKIISKKTFEGTGGIYSLNSEYDTSDYPDEVDPSIGHAEGATKKVVVNAYERSGKARIECIRHYGAYCHICGFDFSKAYGDELGKNFIHVHHLVNISTIGEKYIVDPIKDLRPLCPNCHAMIHKRKPALRLEELKTIIKKNV